MVVVGGLRGGKTRRRDARLMSQVTRVAWLCLAMAFRLLVKVATRLTALFITMRNPRFRKRDCVPRFVHSAEPNTGPAAVDGSNLCTLKR